MEQTRSFAYQEGDTFQAVQLAYAGNRLQMQVLLPQASSSVEALLEQLNDVSRRKTLLTALHDSRGTLILPRFKLRFGADLKAPLAALGLKSAIGPAADFSAMSSSRLYVSQIEHQSFVEVNEEGTEAAAATTAVMALSAVVNAPRPFRMVVDRPFLFLISDRLSSSILFMGAVFDPSAER
jgi:serpin B